ncbi:Protein of unknown function DUF1262 [Macleaya cordata]|uniref:Uncharacterized protein n=1 Tax=Macleaya cordata TaxID=56857 RepID=A0A200Q424_MACCD|nr:Protein of unknown function DUF1262 [Macleaya cordata]
MYMTRPLSLYRRDPSILSTLPQEQEGPNSGYLVIADEETEAEADTCCWGACKNTVIRKLPFHQNQILDDESSARHSVWFVPILDQPLSSNRYYVIIGSGKNKGKAWTSSRERRDMSTSCFGSKVVIDVKPRVFDHRNIYQQVEIFETKSGGFVAKSVAPEGFPPKFLGKKWWVEQKSDSRPYRLLGASGLNLSLRMRLPELNFSISNQYSTTVVVGKWYCPLAFIREGDLKYQMKTNSAMFYKMTLEQFWEEIYECENDNYTPATTGNTNNIVSVRASVQKESVKLFGEEAVKDDTNCGADGFVWFKHVKQNQEGLSSLGLSIAIIEKMKWIQEIGGYVVGGGMGESEDDDDVVRVEKVEQFKGGEDGCWKRFGCFVLVERFALKRMDGTLLLTCDYKHIHRIQSKWE